VEDEVLQIAMEQMEFQKMPEKERLAILGKYFGIQPPEPVETYAEQHEFYETLFPPEAQDATE